MRGHMHVVWVWMCKGVIVAWWEEGKGRAKAAECGEKDKRHSDEGEDFPPSGCEAASG